jgi:hypothetical protein
MAAAPVKIGAREVVAQSSGLRPVTGYRFRSSRAATEEKQGRVVREVLRDQEIRRKRVSITRGKPGRLP